MSPYGWVLLVGNIVFSTTFLAFFTIALILNAELRRFCFLWITWIGWLLVTSLFSFIRVGLGAWHVLRITLDLIAFAALNALRRVFRAFQCATNLYRNDPKEQLCIQLDEASSFEEWIEICAELDELEGKSKWRHNPAAGEAYDWAFLLRVTDRLKSARERSDYNSLMFLLQTSCCRNFCNLSNPELFSVARTGTKLSVDEYTKVLSEALFDLVEAKAPELRSRSPSQPMSSPLSMPNLTSVMGDEAIQTTTPSDRLDDVAWTRVEGTSCSRAAQTDVSVGPEDVSFAERLIPSLTAVTPLVPSPTGRYVASNITATPFNRRQSPPATGRHDCLPADYDLVMTCVSTTHMPRTQQPQPQPSADLRRRIIEPASPDAQADKDSDNNNSSVTPKAHKAASGATGETPALPPSPTLPPSSREMSPSGDIDTMLSGVEALQRRAAFLREKLTFFTNLRLSIGRTALCLSGGGALAMYHLGVVKTLMEHGLMPRVISGTSGGSIVAGMLAICTNEEMKDVIRPDVSERYGVRWFPPFGRQVANFLIGGYMMQTSFFTKTCKVYFGDWTFSEAFKKTGRLVSIAVCPASRRGEVLVCNYVNTPDIYIWSAVVASCALPGLMPPVELYAKGADGKPVPYYPSGMVWMDGSVKRDIPTAELSSLFNVKQFIVSQVNPHHAPFVSTFAAEGRTARAVENWLTMDIKNRYAMLTKFQMVPKLFGQDISGFWLVQDYEGHVTITPRASLMDWWRMMNHPTFTDMSYFIAEGQRRTWPHVPRLKHMLKVEMTLRECRRRLEEQAAAVDVELRHALTAKINNSSIPAAPPATYQQPREIEEDQPQSAGKRQGQSDGAGAICFPAPTSSPTPAAAPTAAIAASSPPARQQAHLPGLYVHSPIHPQFPLLNQSFPTPRQQQQQQQENHPERSSSPIASAASPHGLKASLSNPNLVDSLGMDSRTSSLGMVVRPSMRSGGSPMVSSVEREVDEGMRLRAGSRTQSVAAT
ncbi:unnamed protein product [Vitrella brassicaformis CCMP3155]|uniref:PNPLA domain-containing protein n=2 Tax=Vitrella brassicaformis TaxID=1169539 RepID=A0A0G4FZD3_VITBC|nr:unnamed protein product [Vitrella brassicaformis CCMP3155]|eukprot:CEM20449.1 unnamed protein product [Vitrella brassicaformis CCMP3155]